MESLLARQACVSLSAAPLLPRRNRASPFAAVKAVPIRSFRVSCSVERPDSVSDVLNAKDALSKPGIISARMFPTAPAASQSDQNPFAAFFSLAMDVVKGSIKPAIIALAVSILLSTAMPMDAWAASSGGRVGGSQFSGSRARSYSAPSRSYSMPSPVAPPVYSAPFFAPSPFYGGYGMPFFGPTVVVGGGGGFGFFFNFLLFSMVAFFLWQTVTGFLGQSTEDELWEETQRSSVVRLQVGLLGSARKLQKDLERLADRADTSSVEGLHYILQETVLALLRNPDYCVYGLSTTELNNDSYAGEAAFNRLSMEERSKFREETLVNVGDVRRRSQKPPLEERFSSEFIVVTVIAATEGTFKLPEIKSTSDLRNALTLLGSIPVDELQAVEVLWTPQDDQDTLTARELLEDYPLLRSI